MAIFAGITAGVSGLASLAMGGVGMAGSQIAGAALKKSQDINAEKDRIKRNCDSFKQQAERLAAIQADLSRVSVAAVQLMEVKQALDGQEDELRELHDELYMRNHSSMVKIAIVAIVAIVVTTILVFIVIHRGRTLHSKLDKLQDIEQQLSDFSIPATPEAPAEAPAAAPADVAPE